MKVVPSPPSALMFLLSALIKKNQWTPEEEAEKEEHAALYVLHHWGEMEEFLPGAGRAVALVPEHVEVRSLLTQDKPGQPQVRGQAEHLS